MAETAFRKELAKRFKSAFLVTQIESPATAPGCPDTNLVKRGLGSTVWLELKYEDKPPSKIKLRKAQVPWLRDHCDNMGKAFVVLKTPESIFVWSGIHAKALAYPQKGVDIYRDIPHFEFDIKKSGWRQFLEYIQHKAI